MKNNITYFGLPGSFSNIAAEKFSSAKDLLSCVSLEEIFKRIGRSENDLGVIPIENTLHGRVVESYDLLNKYHLFITNEVVLRINHCLLTVNDGVSVDGIQSCFSHYQAFAQCEKFFESHPGIIQIMVNDTATAAKELSRNRYLQSAVVASKKAASLYGLAVNKEHLEDHKDNFTRFAVIGKKKEEKGEKASILFSVKHIPGSLSQVLSYIASKNFNLTTIESRPIEGKPWEYRFFVDLTKPENGNFNTLVKGLEDKCQSIKLLGIYSRSPVYET